MQSNYPSELLKIASRAAVFVLLVFLVACSEDELPKQEQTVVQISTIDALLTGVYDGETTLSQLAGRGDFGIGTFNALDGEMVLLDGTFYQVKGSGEIIRPGASTQTPFATVTFFQPESSYRVAELDYAGLKKVIDDHLVSANLFYAIRIEGTFRFMKTRSVPAQEKPYPPLVEVTAVQPEFETDSVSGTLSGFYCPPFVTGINVPGYHLHFISGDETFGGHVLAFEMTEGVLEIDRINNFELILPNDNGFLEADLTGDLTDELEDVEGDR